MKATKWIEESNGSENRWPVVRARAKRVHGIEATRAVGFLFEGVPMLRSTKERKQSDEEREQLRQQLWGQFHQPADLIDAVQMRLRESEEDRQLLDALLEYIPEAITIASAADDKIRMVSMYSQQLTGWPCEALEGLHLNEYVQKWTVLHLDGETPITVEELPLARATRKGEVVTDEEWLMRLRDGGTIRVLCNAGPIRNCCGEIIGGVVAWRDITARREAEKRALQAERLAGIGQMIAGLAHESGNALQRSQSCLRLLALRVKEQPEVLDLLDRIQKAQDHLQHLFEDVRGYAAPVNPEWRVCDLPEIWREAWAQLDFTRQGREVALREETGGLDLRCRADHFQLTQVFRNIFDNALAACRDPVVIEIHCSATAIAGQPAIRIALHDNGPGIAADKRSKVFEPFYTTKTKGTGLGLAIVRRIIEAHEGEIAVGESIDSGAEVLITLPRREP